MKPLYKRAKIDTGLLAQSLTDANASGAYFDLSHYRKALVILNVGAIAVGKTVTVLLNQAKDDAGMESKAIEGATATITATEALPNGRALVEIDASDLDINNDFGFVSVNVAVTGTVIVAATLVRGDGRFEPEDDSDALAVI